MNNPKAIYGHMHDLQYVRKFIRLTDKDLEFSYQQHVADLQRHRDEERDMLDHMRAIEDEFRRRESTIEAHTYVSPAFARVHITLNDLYSRHVHLDTKPEFVWGHNSLRHFGKHLLELADKLERK